MYAHSITHPCQYKIYQYLWLVASEDDETQRKGIVLVLWGIGDQFQSPDPSDLASEFEVTMSASAKIAIQLISFYPHRNKTAC
jgi:hypothetical protein